MSVQSDFEAMKAVVKNDSLGLVALDRLRTRMDDQLDVLEQTRRWIGRDFPNAPIIDHIDAVLTEGGRAIPEREEGVDEVEKLKQENVALSEGIEKAWIIIANAHEGNWDAATPEWKHAAEEWRDSVWHKLLFGSVRWESQLERENRSIGASHNR